MTDQQVSLGFSPRPWQKQCYLSMKRFNVIVCHRRGGKTVLAIMLLVSKALRASTQAPRFAYIAPEKAQAKRVAWDMLKRYATVVPGTKVSEVELWVEFPNGARINVDGADDPDRMRGIYLDGCVLDEVADMKPIVWGEVVRPALSDRKGWVLFIGTPKGLNLLSELYAAAQDKPDWFCARYTINDTQAIDASEIERARRDMTIAQFSQEFLCDFNAGDDDVLISADLIDQACQREPMATVADQLVMGVDISRFGNDETVWAFRRGRDARTLPLIAKRGLDVMTTGSMTVELAIRYGVDQIFMDEGGVGGGAIDRVRSLGVACIGVNNGGTADGMCEGILVANKGAECWVKAREWLKDNGALIADQELRFQLGSRRFGYNSNNEIVLERKQDMKKRGIPSPDRADAFCLTFAHPVAMKPVDVDMDLRSYVRRGSVQHNAAGDYDPLRHIH